MLKKKIYLAGPLSKWREEVFSKLSTFFNIYDPIKHSRQRSQVEYVPDDIAAVKNSDIIIAFQPKDSSPCLGMAVEATMGYCNGAMVVYIDERGKLDPFLIGISKRSFSDMNLAIEFLINLSNDKQ